PGHDGACAQLGLLQLLYDARHDAEADDLRSVFPGRAAAGAAPRRGAAAAALPWRRAGAAGDRGTPARAAAPARAGAPGLCCGWLLAGDLLRAQALLGVGHAL